jgi:hypothetical protein
LSRVAGFGRPLLAPQWRRASRAKSGRARFEAFPARVAALTALAALVLGNAVIVYQVTTHDVDPSSGGSRESREANVGGSLSDIGEVLRGIRASIDARIEGIDRIPIERSARQNRGRDLADQLARRSSESSASSGPAPSGSSSSGSSSNSSGSSSAETAESKSSGGTSGGTGSSDSGGETQDTTTGGTAGGGGGGGGGAGSVGGEAPDGSVTGGGGGGGGG